MQLTASKPKVVVTSASTFWQPKEAVESEMALAEFAELKHELGDKVEIGSTTYRETVGQKLKRTAMGFLKKLPYLALGAGALGVGLASAGALSPLAAAGLAVAATGGVTLAAASPVLKGALKQRNVSSILPAGLAAQHSGFEKLSFDKLKVTSGPGDGLREMTLTNMKNYPSAMHVVHLNGHGFGAKAVAGLTGKDARESMKEAVQRSGQKYDVAFIETCYGSNFESLHSQAEVADYAVAFEDAIPKSTARLGRLNLSHVLGQAVDAEDARQAAIRMAEFSGAHFDQAPSPISSVPFPRRQDKEFLRDVSANPDSTTVAVDLRGLRSKLSPALDQVGRDLLSALESDKTFSSKVQEARKENMLERTGDLVDLGGFLSSVRNGLPDGALKANLDKSLDTLDSVLLHKRTGRELPLSGISFHARPQSTDFFNPTTPAHQDVTLPRGWTAFVDRAFEPSIKDILTR